MADDKQRETLYGNELNVLDIQLVASAERSAITIQEYISTRTLQGASIDLVSQELLDDLKNNGRLFGEYTRAIKATAHGNIKRVADVGLYSETGLDENYRWITVQDSKVCPDCGPRHADVMSWEEWSAVGLPRSGWSVCRSNCRCELVKTEADVPVITRRKRKSDISSGFTETPDNIAKKFGYKINRLNKKPKGYYAKTFQSLKKIEVYTKGRTPGQIEDTLRHEVGHVVDYKRRGIEGDMIRDYTGKLVPMADHNTYFRQEYLFKEAQKIRALNVTGHHLSMTQKEIYADSFRILLKNPEKLKSVAPNIYGQLKEYYDSNIGRKRK